MINAGDTVRVIRHPYVEATFDMDATYAVADHNSDLYYLEGREGYPLYEEEIEVVKEPLADWEKELLEPGSTDLAKPNWEEIIEGSVATIKKVYPYEPQVGDIVDAHRKDWGSETPGLQWGWAQGLTVSEVDDWQVRTTKPGETFPRAFSRDVLTLVSRPSAEETKAETERDYLGGVHYKNLKEGDTIGFVSGEYFSIYRDKQPEPQEPEVVRPKTGTRGTALIDGERTPGIIDEDGDFKYLYFDGDYVEIAYYTWSNSLEFEPEV